LLKVQLWVKHSDNDPDFRKELEVLAVPRVGETLFCPQAPEEPDGKVELYEVTVISVAHCAAGYGLPAKIYVYGQPHHSK